jgi:hypothetical protein
MLACTGLLGVPASGCDVYDPDKLDPVTSGRGGNTAGRSGAGGTEPEPCVPSDEICNDKDDDCNGTIDDQEAASRDCSVRYHAKVECGRSGLCVFVPSSPMCDPGYYHCDGLPQNGCESTTPCCTNCPPDAGADDAGEDDSGTEN